MFAILSCAIVFLCTIYWFYCGNTLSTIPGPDGQFLLGNILQLNLKKPFLQLAKWAQQFGGIYKIRLAGQKIVVVNDYNTIRDVLIVKGDDFSDRPPSFRVAYLTGQYSEFAFAPRTKKMKQLKKYFMSHVKMYGTGAQKVEGVVSTITSKLMDDLVATNGQKVFLKDHISKTIASIICVLGLGRQASSAEIEVIQGFSQRQIRVLAVGGMGELLDTFPWLRYFGISVWMELQECRDLQDRQYRKWRDEALVKLKEGNENDNYLSKILQIIAGENELGFTEDNAEHSIWVMFAAGVGTSTTTFCCLLNTLAQKKDVLRKLQQESDNILKGQNVQLSNRSSMHYHMAAIYEISRLATVVPLCVPHFTACDTSVGQYAIPKGTMVWPNIWALHHDPEVWGDPFEFRPERYLDEEGCLVYADHPSRKNNLAFSAGPRVCAGEVLAMSRLFLMLAMIVQKFDILPGTTLEEQVSWDCREMTLGLTLAPPPAYVRFVQRNKD